MRRRQNLARWPGTQTRKLILALAVAGTLASAGCRRVEEPAPPLPGTVKATMHELLWLYTDPRPKEKAEFHRLLQAVAPQLPSIAVTTGNQPLKWATVTINQHAERFDAVRFTSPLDVAADLRWCLILGDKKLVPLWNIHALQGDSPAGLEGYGISNSPAAAAVSYRIEENLQLDVPGVPDRNVVFLQPLDGGQIRPGVEYVLWFAYRDVNEPVTVHLAIRLEPQRVFPKSTTAEQLARDLGLPAPLKHTRIESAEELLNQAKLQYEFHHLPAALERAERARQLMPDHRGIQLWAGYLNLLRGRQLAENYGLERGSSHLLLAAQHLRRFRERNDQRSEAESAFVAEAIYYEAECLARTNDKEKSLASLRESLACGFDPAQVAAQHFQPTVAADELEAVVAEFRKK